MWSASRWHAYNVMSAFADLSKSGIHSPADLISFTWDKPKVTDEDIPTDEEVEDTMRMLDEMNMKKTAIHP